MRRHAEWWRTHRDQLDWQTIDTYAMLPGSSDMGAIVVLRAEDRWTYGWLMNGEWCRFAEGGSYVLDTFNPTHWADVSAEDAIRLGGEGFGTPSTLARWLVWRTMMTDELKAPANMTDRDLVAEWECIDCESGDTLRTDDLAAECKSETWISRLDTLFAMVTFSCLNLSVLNGCKLHDSKIFASTR